MFERYTEHARRSIFFARYEASVFGTMEITTEELLLGILREDKTLGSQIGLDELIAIRKELEQLATPAGERVPTSVDLPLSEESKSALEYAAEEAGKLDHKQIDAPHLVLGLLRVEGCLAAKLLRKHGLEYERYWRTVGHRVSEVELHTRPPIEPKAKSLDSAIQALEQLVDGAAARFRESVFDGDRHLKRKDWTRKEALGHLIDWAMAHQQWVAQAVMEGRLAASGYPDQAAVGIQGYADFSWAGTVDLWVALNGLLIHLLHRVPEDKVYVPCKIGIAEPVPLAKLIDVYVERCHDVVGQILARLD